MPPYSLKKIQSPSILPCTLLLHAQASSPLYSPLKTHEKTLSALTFSHPSDDKETHSRQPSMPIDFHDIFLLRPIPLLTNLTLSRNESAPRSPTICLQMKDFSISPYSSLLPLHLTHQSEITRGNLLKRYALDKKKTSC